MTDMEELMLRALVVGVLVKAVLVAFFGINFD